MLINIMERNRPDGDTGVPGWEGPPERVIMTQQGRKGGEKAKKEPLEGSGHSRHDKASKHMAVPLGAGTVSVETHGDSPSSRTSEIRKDNVTTGILSSI
jgi:hypothetical protein